MGLPLVKYKKTGDKFNLKAYIISLKICITLMLIFNNFLYNMNKLLEKKIKAENNSTDYSYHILAKIL